MDIYIYVIFMYIYIYIYMIHICICISLMDIYTSISISISLSIFRYIYIYCMCFERSDDISCSPRVNPSDIDQFWAGRNTYLWIYIYIYIIKIIQNLKIFYLKFQAMNDDFQAILKLLHSSNTLILDKV